MTDYLFDNLLKMTKKETTKYIFQNKVIIVCPTYNRRNFLPSLIYQFCYQTYPKNLLTMIILDDSDISNEDIFNSLDNDIHSRILYLYDKEKKPIGEKRNILNDIAKSMDCTYIVCFDDDDYYPPDRVEYGIRRLEETGYLIGGSSALPVYYPDIDNIYISGPFVNKIYYGHATNGTLLYHVNFLENHRYLDTDTKAEEMHFLNNFKISLLQIPYEHVMLCIAHLSNTVDKYELLHAAKLLDSKIEYIITDSYLLNFFKNVKKTT
jgi:glycosyltransferase involved in cell wall biosynthesis